MCELREPSKPASHTLKTFHPATINIQLWPEADLYLHPLDIYVLHDFSDVWVKKKWKQSHSLFLSSYESLFFLMSYELNDRKCFLQEKKTNVICLLQAVTICSVPSVYTDVKWAQFRQEKVTNVNRNVMKVVCPDCITELWRPNFKLSVKLAV